MRPISIKAENFGPFADLYLDMSNLGLCVVVGENGAGKTTLPDLIRYALYGETRGRDKASVIRHGTNKALVVVRIESASGVWEIEREQAVGKTHQVRLFDIKKGKRIERSAGKQVETNEAIIERIGLPHSAFELGAFLTPASAANFLEAAPAQRIQYLTDLIPNIDSFSAMADKVNSLVSESKAVLDKSEQAKIDLRTIEPQLKAANKALKKARTRMVDAQASVTVSPKEIEAKRSALRRAEASLKTIVREIKSASDMSEWEDLIEEAKEERRLADARVKDATKQVARLTAEIDSRQSEAQSIAATIDEAEERISTLEETHSTKCPVCASPLDGKKVKQLLKSARAELEKLEAMLLTAQSSIKERKASLRSEESVLRDAERTIKISSKSIDTIQATMQDAVKKGKTKEALRHAKKSAQKEISELEAQIDDAQIDAIDNLHEATKEFEDAVTKVSSIKRDHSLCLELIAEASANTHDSNVVEALSKAFDRGGIVTMLIERAARNVEDLANVYLAALTNGAITVELATQRETKKGTMSETLEVVASLDGRSGPINTFSAGERSVIGVAVGLAFAEVAGDNSAQQIDFCVVDEMDRNLMGDRAKAFAELLLRRVQDGRLKTCLVISHNPEMQNVLQRRMTVTKEPTGSTIEVR